MSSEFEEFLAFKEFKAMKSAASAPPRAPAPAPPPPPPAYAVQAAAPVLGPSLLKELFPEPTPSYLSVAAKPYTPEAYVLPKLDKPLFRSAVRAEPREAYSYPYATIFQTAMLGMRYNQDSKNMGEYLHLRSLFEEYPERFELRSQIHIDQDKGTYFSYAYQNPIPRPNGTGTKYAAITFHIYGDIGPTSRHPSRNHFSITSISWMYGARSESRQLHVQQDDDSRSSVSS